MTVLVTILTILLVLDCLVLIGIILLQRGRGGGLASAFGGMGAESAFGTRAATMAQKITLVCAIIFVALAILIGRLRRIERYAAKATPQTTAGSEAGTQRSSPPGAEQHEGEGEADRGAK